ncbi:hypothetical protein [uncultured Thiodictyon sp.]|uniref:hypothetical protein n=1 Tax=uncultured Thiodictyon sp. TaxID=1846217 RepID=UPI0025D50303|nr:hypothetical protein [uncultured Thiodictyon sp.]
MRHFIRRFVSAIRTIPRRVRLILIAPVAFIALLVIDARLAVFVFLLVLGGLVVRELLTSRSRHYDRVRSSNPSTGLKMTGIAMDSGGFFYGEKSL